MVLHEFKGIIDLTPFWVKNLEKNHDFSLWTQLLLEFTSDVHQTWYMYSSKYKDDPLEKGVTAPGSFWVKNLEKIAILSLWTQLLLEFSLDIYQTWYVHSPKHTDDPCEKGLRSGVI